MAAAALNGWRKTPEQISNTSKPGQIRAQSATRLERFSAIQQRGDAKPLKKRGGRLSSRQRARAIATPGSAPAGLILSGIRLHPAQPAYSLRRFLRGAGHLTPLLKSTAANGGAIGGSGPLGWKKQLQPRNKAFAALHIGGRA